VADIKFCSIKDWCRISGIGRSSVYSLIGEKKLRAVKFAGKTLIDVPAGLRFMATLPEAQIGKQL
jgi:hypothetical protein